VVEAEVVPEVTAEIHPMAIPEEDAERERQSDAPPPARQLQCLLLSSSSVLTFWKNSRVHTCSRVGKEKFPGLVGIERTRGKFRKREPKIFKISDKCLFFPPSETFSVKILSGFF
jgi:hypothetical protein